MFHFGGKGEVSNERQKSNAESFFEGRAGSGPD
jgi:hypothetical protein